ncbi:MAG: cell division protein ZapA [Nitrospirales bacterium]
MTKTIQVEVFGQRFNLQGEGDEAYFHELAGYVDAQIRQLAQQTPTSTPTKLAILAAINITDQLFRQERQRQNGDSEIERRAQTLLETIEKYFETHPN